MGVDLALPVVDLGPRVVDAARRGTARQCVTVAGDPGVDPIGQPRDPGSDQQRPNRTPYEVSVAQRGGDGSMTTGGPPVLPDPLNGRSALVLGEAELVQAQLLPWSDESGSVSDHPPVEPTGG